MCMLALLEGLRRPGPLGLLRCSVMGLMFLSNEGGMVSRLGVLQVATEHICRPQEWWSYLLHECCLPAVVHAALHTQNALVSASIF